MTNIRMGSVDLSELKFTDLSAEQYKTFRLHQGDVLFNRTNSFELVGRSGIWTHGETEAVFASYLVRLHTTEALLPDYLNLYINSDPGQAKIRALVSRGVSQANVSASRLKSLVMPVPDVAQQARLVEEYEVGVQVASLVASELRSATLVRNRAREILFGGADQ